MLTAWQEKNEQHHLAKTDENSALPSKTYDLKQGHATDMDCTLHNIWKLFLCVVGGGKEKQNHISQITKKSFILALSCKNNVN